ncbi:bifunctional 4-hydroxy-2-oxoglutarate aldolase/2-dehydro-3-deoxy-phosphogluconate aldolase [Georgenia sp. EYE_87]|uniref:bifunctional 4-hydroxy-2-oxoglutarate aldolase/2-dehydro-3-deoxy-phosphogluconate aldolase n=1 Tax=Georgenia sp. EYE_87 TaxID=2853448 RepID=UPI002006405A|nr:bifunctional 4-hydroxy-2-oxoglutarate aldolase/2-dehydro-3-deoxy-phosphogluconate aldolase [Georgenia sp. EYE_87]MCK6211927.1 bifunctional 4-hydroxy-2-oxoglutarate aldolase/2-dehydro-3-deoxy-phosphogluconate aldolase [Georgenia sp. EYE_87]
MSDDVLGAGVLPDGHAAVLERLGELRLLPVVVLENAADAVPLGRALAGGGLPVAEVTFRTAAAADAVRALTDARLSGPDGHELLVGAGTVVTPAQVDAAVAAGASFVVSPGLSPAVVERCREHGVLVVPGTATATEVQTALTMGLRTVKFFPAATSGGPAAVRALSAPFPQMRFVPTGGITEGDVAEYLALPAVLAAGGSWMVPASAVAAGDFDEVRRLTEGAVAATRRPRP